MDRYDPPDRPSIFTRPEDVEIAPGPPTERRQEPTEAVQYERPMSGRPADPKPAAPVGPSRRFVIGLGVSALLVVLTGGFIAGSILGPDNEDAIGATSPTESTSLTPTPPSSPTLTSTAQATATAPPSPSPVPTPADPPLDIALGAWATVAVDELNVRSEAGTDAASNYRLVRGAVVFVAEGPANAAGMNWYRVASLGGAVGWVASGRVAEPFLTILPPETGQDVDGALTRCGTIESAVFDIVGGVPTPHDPITLGDLALPAAAFSEVSLGAMELLRGVGGQACFTAKVGPGGAPAVDARLTANACGHAVLDGNLLRLHPAEGQTIPGGFEVTDPAYVHPEVLAGAFADDPLEANLRNVVDLMGATPDSTGCIHFGVNERGSRVGHETSVDTRQCFIVSERASGGITLSAAAGGESKRLLVSDNTAADLPLAVPIRLGLFAGSQGTVSYGYVHLDGGC